MPALWLARGRQHLRDHSGLAAGEDLDGLARLDAACGHAAPEHAAALRGHAGVVEFFDPLHWEAEGHIGLGRRHRQVFEDAQKAGACVATPFRL
jgi:hypothetical protein